MKGSTQNGLLLPVLVRGMDDARAALTVAQETGRPALLISERGAAGFAGAGWWAALIDEVTAEFPQTAFTAWLHCADAAGHVMGAIREGVRDIVFDGDTAIAAKLADQATQAGARLHRDAPQAIDLRGTRDKVERLRHLVAKANSPT